MAYGNKIQKWIYYQTPPFIKNLITSVYGWKQKKRRFGTTYKKYFRFLEESQWYSNEKLKEIQFDSMKAFLIHASEYSKFYNRLFKELDFCPIKIKTFSDLRSIPILQKTTLRDNLDSIVSTNINPKESHWNSTGGTTMLGLHFPESNTCFERQYAFRFHNYSCGGINVGDKWAFCAGHPVASPQKNKPPFWTYDYANNWLLLSSYHMAEKNLSSYIEELASFAPALIGGYPSSVYLLAIANEYFGNKVHPKAVYTASERLFDFQRETIERSFGCKAYTHYGNAEAAGFIAECEKDSLHVKLEHSFMELVNDSGDNVAPGQVGRLIWTAFGNYDTPLIRYDIGDTAILADRQECSCGRGGVILEDLVGRIEDYIITPDGRYVGRMDHPFKDAIKVRMAQIVQNSIDSIIIRVVKEDGYGMSDEQSILKGVRERLGDEMMINFEYVDDIKRTKNGKYRFILRNIPDLKAFGKILPSVYNTKI